MNIYLKTALPLSSCFFFVYYGSNFDGRKDLTFSDFKVFIQIIKNSLNGRFVRGAYLRPHTIPQSFLEHMETVDKRGSKSKWFPDESAINCLKWHKKCSIIYLGTGCRRFEPGHPDQKQPRMRHLSNFWLFSVHDSNFVTITETNSQNWYARHKNIKIYCWFVKASNSYAGTAR